MRYLSFTISQQKMPRHLKNSTAPRFSIWYLNGHAEGLIQHSQQWYGNRKELHKFVNGREEMRTELWCGNLLASGHFKD
jgi:hypothetical protein